MKHIRLLLPAAAFVGVALFAAPGYDVHACGGPCPPTPTPEPTRPPVVGTFSQCEGTSYVTRRFSDGQIVSLLVNERRCLPKPAPTLQPPASTPVPAASNWVVEQTCAGTLHRNTTTGMVQRLDDKAAPGCSGATQVYAPSQAPVVQGNRDASVNWGIIGSYTTTSQVSGVRIQAPRTGDGGLVQP